jgi:hypothetical protein
MEPGFFSRLALSLVAFFKVLFDARFAGQFLLLREGRLAAPQNGGRSEGPRPPSAPPSPTVNDHSPALLLVGAMQREGRLIDFLNEDISTFDDADVGAAVRIVHEGCRRVVAEYLVMEPVRTDGDGATVVLESGFDAGAVKLVGNVAGEPPFEGKLRHPGWRVREVRIPRASPGIDVRVIAPAEVEL